MNYTYTQLRLLQGMSLKELGDKVGVTDEIISDIECGIIPIPTDLAPKMAKALKCSLKDL